MKKTILSALLFITAFAGEGQNLVPNGDFEQYYGCPTGFSQLDSAKFWNNPSGGTPDYFNQCALPGFMGVPDNNFGWQPAHSGNAYYGAIIWYGGPSPNYREYAETSLTAPLTANQCYYFEMYVALAEMSDHTTSSIGVYFSNTLVSGIAGYFPLPFTPQIVNTTGFVTDTMNWTLISGTYTASGGEQYLIIGNFYDDANTTTQPNNFGGFQEAYFYVDDVSLTPCTGIDEQNENTEIKIYPNPVRDEFQVSGFGFGEKTKLSIYNMKGRKVFESAIHNRQSAINIKSLSSGIYFVEINNGKNIFRKKFLKENVK